MAKKTVLPPGIGAALGEPELYNPYLAAFQNARRMRYCLQCQKIFSMQEGQGQHTCPHCKTFHPTNITAPRVFDNFLLLAGRGGGKTYGGAFAAREEMLIPNSLGWVMGATYKILHDSTFPTLIQRIPESWVKHWDGENWELTLINNARVAFRSLDDPERARGPHGISWGWIDEAAQAPERAFDVFRPTLIKAGGIVIATTTVLGYDWTYDRIEKLATSGEKGYWSIKWHTEENPVFQSSPIMKRRIEQDRRTMTPEFFDQEYRAERMNATGSVYGKYLPSQFVDTDAQMKLLIPEWPKIDASRKILIGLDSGSDHPFGAVKIVVTEFGLVIVDEYLERMQANSLHHKNITARFNTSYFANKVWAANKNEVALRLEFGLAHTGVMKAEAKHDVGIQRVQSWLFAKQLWFAPTVPKTREQFKAYRYAVNLATDGQKKKEDVFKLHDELPDAVRYALMSFPQLPDNTQVLMSDGEKARWAALDDRSKLDIERMREYNKAQLVEARDLQPVDDGYPIGDFFGSSW